MGDSPNSDTLSCQAVDPLALMQRVADQALAAIDGADGVLIGVLINASTLCHVCGAGYLTGHVGGTLRLEQCLSGEAIRQGRTLICHETESDPRVNRAATRAYSVRSSVCVPLRRADTRVGVLNVSAARPGAFDEHDVALLSHLADFISAVIGAASDFTRTTARLFAEPHARGAIAGRFIANVLDPVSAQENAARGRIEHVLQAREFSLAYQPIFELHSGALFAVEALTRFSDGEPPDARIAQAHHVGLGVELEVAVVEQAIAQLERLPCGATLALNAGPTALSSGRISRTIACVDPSRVIVELTEQIRVDDYPHLAEVLQELRRTGVRLAVDDAGAGFAGLAHILKLAPDLIKLDRQLTSGIDIDPVRRSLANSLMRFASETGAVIVAEGIETAGELDALRALGIQHGQGFHLARPGPISGVRQSVEHGDARIRGAQVDAFGPEHPKRSGRRLGVTA